MKRAVIFLVLVVLLLVSVSVYAQDGSPTDNACNPGGALDGKCTTDWHWTCGWYLARFYQGTAAGVPSSCQSLVSSLPAELQKPGALAYIPPYEPEVGSAGDNACNEGGSMTGKCTTDWHWTCGWYLARYDAGVFKSVPAACQILLDVRPPRPEAASSSVTTTACFNSVAGLVCVTGNVFTGDNAPPDGVIDVTYYLLTDAVVGPSGTCPAGTAYVTDITGFIADVEAFVLSLGFPPTGDICL
ncbi:MAG: hypothetical protein KJ064_01175 [Anaerolineae bacterium]|nr:hypothetical protein [Anaerolineae bacterium]